VQFPEVIFQLKKYATAANPIYLVGGAVRDALLGRSCRDFDFICVSDARNIAKRFADENNGIFFMLDEDRNTSRVILGHRTPEQMVFDFAQIRGSSIESDLMERDFSINAMAVDLNSPEIIIDPTKGGRDLQQKWLRPVKKTSMDDDPVRAIRAVRYAVNLGLHIESDSARLIRSASKGLIRVSNERKRDELFKILDGQKIGTALQLLRKFSIFEEIGLDVRSNFDLACRELDVLVEIIAMICGKNGADKNTSFYRISMLLRLGRFKNQLEKHYYQKNLTGRDRKSLVLIYQIVERVGREEVVEKFHPLALSTDEVEVLKILADHVNLLDSLMTDIQSLESRTIYKFFAESGETGIDLIFLALSEYASRLASEFSQDRWLQMLEICETLIEAWFCRPDVIAPKPFLNGNELMFHFDLTPGPLIGEIIDNMKEEQAAGNIKTKEDALDWVDLRLQRNSL
jgi:hypothetical protein